MSELSIKDINLVLQGKSQFPLVYVKGYEDNMYKFLHKLAKDINPKVEDNMYSVSQEINKLFVTLRYMEEYDYENMVRKIRGYC